MTPGDECRLWEVGTWRLAKVIPRDPGLGAVLHAVFSPDGETLAISYVAKVVRLVEPSSGRELATLTAPNPEALSKLCFSRDGSQLAGVCASEIQVWDLRLIRRQLADLGLDWDLAPYPPSEDLRAVQPIRIEIVPGEAAPPRQPVPNSAKIIADIGRLLISPWLLPETSLWTEP